MSATNEEADLKAGHPPAVKAGGMRVARNRTTSGPEQEQPMTKEEQEEYGTSPKPDTHSQQVLVSGVVGKGDRDFHVDALKQYHEKPHASREKPRAAPTHRIQQPK